MDAQLRKDMLEFLTPLPAMQTEKGRRAPLLSAGLDAILAQTDLSGAPRDAVTLLVNALEQYGTIGDTLALVTFLQEIARQVGTDKQRQIQNFCQRLIQQQNESQQPHISDEQTQAGVQGQHITAQHDYFEHIEGQAQVFTGPVNIYQGTPPPASPEPTRRAAAKGQRRKEAQMSAQEASPEEWDVFICYAREDVEMAKRLYDDLERAGVSPWLDRKKLLPGQNWKRAIKQAMKDSAYVLALLSSNSVSKTGYVQKELREALDLLEHFPPSKIFIIPARLDDCRPVDERLQDLHRVDLFSSYEEGLERIMQVLVSDSKEEKVRKSTQLSDQPAHESEQTKKTPCPSNFKRLEQALYEEVPITSPSIKKLTYVVDKTTGKKPRIQSKPLTVSTEEYWKTFKLNENSRPREYIQNDFEDQGELVVDHATGLMWQKSGSENYMNYAKTQEYVEELNRQKFAGHDDWRLPTIPELMSLLEPEKQPNGLYMGPIFDVKKQYYWCWSADRLPAGEKSSPELAWVVLFHYGYVSWLGVKGDDYVRVVRSRQ